MLIGLALLSAQASSAALASPCLGHPYAECISFLKSTLNVDDSEVAHTIADLNKVDVNGKRLRQTATLLLTFQYPGKLSTQLVNLTLDAQNRVESMDASLASDPGAANTADEYDESGLLTVFRTALPDACWQGDKGALYRFFQNTVKPKIVHEKKTSSVSEVGARSSSSTNTPNIPFCGIKMSYGTLVAWDTEDITLENPHGFSGISTIVFER